MVSAVVGLVLFAFVVSTPLWASAGTARVVADLLVLVAVAEAVAVLAGAGVLLIGVFGLSGFGALALVEAVDRLELNPVVGVAVAGGASLVLGVVLVPVVLRLSPVGASLATWVGAAAAAAVAGRVGPLADGAPHDITAVAALGSRDALATSLAVVLGIGAVLAAHGLRRSPSGLALRAATDEPEAAAALDLPLRRARWVTWLVAATVVGAAGAVTAFQQGSVDAATAFSLTAWTVPALIAVGIGGLDSIEGPMVGAGLWVLASELVDGHDVALQLTAVVLALLCQAVLGPGGLWGRVSSAAGLRPFPVHRAYAGRGRAARRDQAR